MAILGRSDNTANVHVKTTSDNKGIDDTKKGLQSLDKEADKSSSGLTNFGGAAKYAQLAVAALSAGAIAAGVSMVKSAAEFEQTRIGLENMLGSADNARSLLADISNFAAQTPFEFPELAGATRQLVAFGFSGEDAFDTMKNLGDVSAAIGAPINDLAYLMGTLRTQGKAMTVDIRQFAQRGVPIYQYLAKVLKVNEEAVGDLVTEGKVGFKEVSQAFQMMTSEGGQFHGAMEKQSKSLSGLWSTLKDNIGQAGRELIGINQQGDIAKGSVFDVLRQGLLGLTGALPALIDDLKEFMSAAGELAAQIGDYLGPKLAELVKVFGEELGPMLYDLWHEVLEPLIPVIGTALVVAIGAVIDIATVLVKALGWVYEEFRNGNPIILGLAGVFGTLAAAMAFNAVFNALTIGFNMLTLVEIPRVMASVTALRTLIMTPIVMPAIVVGAAIAALVLVYDQAVKTMQAVDAAMEAQDLASASNADAIRRIQQSNMPKEWKARKIREISEGGASVPGFAVGTNYAPGGMALVGEKGPELVNLPRGSQVKTNAETQRIMSQPSQTINIQQVVLTTGDAVRSFFDVTDRDAQAVSMGLTPTRGQA